MKYLKSIFVCLLFVSTSFSQQGIEGHELGFDGAFNASTFGGSYGIGVKYGLKKGENLAFGPSFRLQRSWWQNQGGQKGGFTNYGGGAWVHYRYANYVFAGAEFEMLNTRLVNPQIYGKNYKWIPTFFLGGGFSRDFNEKFRLNAGMFFDIINDLNSPFRSAYVLKSTNSIGQEVPIPVIYRLGIFIPIG
jgi:hypothetical protein